MISVLTTLVLLALATMVGTAVAQSPGSESISRAQNKVALAATVNSRINYQGVLEENGVPVNGSRDMVFRFYTNDTCGGVAVYVSPMMAVAIADGFFDVDVDVPHGVFHGGGVWLAVEVDGTTMGCEEILPTPYALSLRPGATIVGEATGASLGDGIVNLENTAPAHAGSVTGLFARTATGSAVRAESDGVGVHAASVWQPAFVGETITGTAATLQSGAGYGLRVNTDGDDHWDHAGYFTANWGYGLYVTSTHNMAVRGEAGDTSALWQPVGSVGVVGIGESRGVYGSAGTGAGVSGISKGSQGVYGQSEGNDLTDAGVYGRGSGGPGVYGISYGGISGRSYGGYFYSQNYRGLYSSSDTGWWAGFFDNRGGSTEPGVYVDGTLTVTGSKSGYVVDVVQNAGDAPLETGHVVVIAGVAEPVLGEIPVVRVMKSAEAASMAVMGVVDQPFSSGEGEGSDGVAQPTARAALAATNSAIQPGDYASVVTLGAFKAIRVDGSYGAIQPGDLLVSSPTPGHAMRADAPAAGTVIGKALEAWEGGQGTIAVMLTLQ
jgi:hypothetical protein